MEAMERDHIQGR